MLLEKLAKKDIEKLAKDAPKTGVAEIRLINPKKTGSITVRGYNHDGQFRPYVDEHGNERILRVNKKILLNLEKLSDQLTYEQVRLHPHYVTGANAVLKLINLEKEDEDFVNKKDRIAIANAIIAKLKGTELQDFARILTVPFAVGSTETSIKRKLYDESDLDPDKVINAWENPDRELQGLLYRGLEAEVFTKGGGVYKFKGTVMGTSFELAVEWLKENDDLLPSIRKEIKK